MRVKCITGTFDKEDIFIEITDSEQESAGEIITPDQYDWTEKNYPGALKKVESELFYLSGLNEGEGFIYIEEKHPLFNIDLVSEMLDTDNPKERTLYIAVVNLLRPLLS
jgi:hypothetical protein